MNSKQKNVIRKYCVSNLTGHPINGDILHGRDVVLHDHLSCGQIAFDTIQRGRLRIDPVNGGRIWNEEPRGKLEPNQNFGFKIGR